MKGIIKYILLYTILFFPSVDAVNKLHKVFHHRSGMDNSSRQVLDHIELGKLVFYFDKNPEVELTSGKNQKTFFFPDVHVDEAARKSIEELQRYAGKYRFVLKQIKFPKKGLELRILFDPQVIDVSYEFFDSIGLKKGIVFHIYNKELIDSIQKKSRPILQMVSNNKQPKVVIDCGHGGIDTGTIGINNVAEKDVCLEVGTMLAQELKKKGITTVLTRDDDRTLAIDERTSYANKARVDLFISLHANHASSQHANGIETYCLHTGLLKQPGGDGTMQTQRFIQNFNNYRCKLSATCAQIVHNSVIQEVQTQEKQINDRKVKKAVSQVLLGTTMPSILIELGFLSNKIEAEHLIDKNYQQYLAQGICKGVVQYFKKYGYYIRT